MNHLALHYEMPLLPVVKFPLDAQQIKRAYMAGNQRRQGMFFQYLSLHEQFLFSAPSFLLFSNSYSASICHTSRLILPVLIPSVFLLHSAFHIWQDPLATAGRTQLFAYFFSTVSVISTDLL